MTVGLLCGLLAALSWGLTDILAAVTARRVGTLRATAGGLLISLLGLLAYAAVAGLAFPADPMRWLPIGLLGVSASIAYLTFWQALRLGPIAVVSPIGASFGALSVVGAVVFLGERPSQLQWLAVPLTSLGSVLAAVVFERGARRRPRLVGLGPLFAVVSVVCFAIATVGLAGPTREIGWAQAILVSRLFNVVTTWSIMLAITRRSAGRGVAGALDSGAAAAPSAPEPPLGATGEGVGAGDAGGRAHGPVDAWAIGLMLLLGATDVVGMVGLGIGLSLAPAWLVSLAASTGPVVAIAGGLAVFHERLRPNQWVGVALVAAGIALIAVR